MRIYREAGGYVADCPCGWAKWSPRRPIVEQAATTHADRCKEKK